LPSWQWRESQVAFLDVALQKAQENLTALATFLSFHVHGNKFAFFFKKIIPLGDNCAKMPL
jgi:hypothetical protein